MAAFPMRLVFLLFCIFYVSVLYATPVDRVGGKLLNLYQNEITACVYHDHIITEKISKKSMIIILSIINLALLNIDKARLILKWERLKFIF